MVYLKYMIGKGLSMYTAESAEYLHNPYYVTLHKIGDRRAGRGGITDDRV